MSCLAIQAGDPTSLAARTHIVTVSQIERCVSDVMIVSPFTAVTRFAIIYCNY